MGTFELPSGYRFKYNKTSFDKFVMLEVVEVSGDNRGCSDCWAKPDANCGWRKGLCLHFECRNTRRSDGKSVYLKRVDE